MPIIKFEANIPQTLAFTYDTGKATEGQYGEQFFRKTKDGDSVYLAPIVEDRLKEMGYKAGKTVVICKRVSGKSTHWSVGYPGDAQEYDPERPLQSQAVRATPVNPSAPAPNTTRTNGASSGLGTANTVMQNCLRAAVDLAIWTHDYAKSKGHLLPLEFPAVKEIANTLFIQHSKAGNIRAMHDYREMEQQPNTDSQFRQAGSQSAADAVAQRKIAEQHAEMKERSRSDADEGPPPAWVDDVIASEDLSFLGETRRGI